MVRIMISRVEVHKNFRVIRLILPTCFIAILELFALLFLLREKGNQEYGLGTFQRKSLL